MDLKKQFLEECGVDLTDYEYAGKFPSRNKRGVWGNIPRGEGWKRYSEWLESKLKNNGVLGDVSVSVRQEIERRVDLILSEPNSVVRETMIQNLPLDL